MTRRLLASLIDYGVVLGWLAILAAVAVPLYLAGYLDWAQHHPDLVALAASVFPVWAYLTLTETSRAHATWGKRRLGLVVDRPSARRVALRNAVKLVPWELAHLGVIELYAGDRPTLAWTSIIATYALVILTVALAFLRSDRAALHDLLAGTRVVRRTP